MIYDKDTVCLPRHYSVKARKASKIKGVGGEKQGLVHHKYTN